MFSCEPWLVLSYLLLYSLSLSFVRTGPPGDHMQHPLCPPQHQHQQEQNRWPAEQSQGGPGGEPPRFPPPDDDLEAIAEAEARAQVAEAKAEAAAAAAAAAAVKEEEEEERARATESDPTTLAVVRERLTGTMELLLVFEKR